MVAFLLLCVFGLVGCSSGDESIDEKQEVVSDAESESVETKEAENDEADTEEEEEMIVEDKEVNAFLQECDFDYGEVDSGNIRTKYFIHINNCYTELLNSNTDELIITING